MNNKVIKDVVLEVLKESWGTSQGLSTYHGNNSLSSTQGLERHRNNRDMDDEEEENPVSERLREILKNLDSDPGYEQAIAICKILVKNKSILRDMLEFLLEQQELAEEFVNSFEV